MGQVQNYNLYIWLSSHEKLLVILFTLSTDSVKVAFKHVLLIVSSQG